MSQRVTTSYKFVEVTPTISTSAYTANDTVGGLQTLTGVASDADGGCVLRSLTITDKAAQSAALTLFFYSDDPTLAADNAAYSESDADNAAKCIGHVTIAAGDYQTSALNSTACVKNIGLVLKCQETGSNAEPRSGKIYVGVKTTGTPTYASTTDLVFKYSFEQ